MGERPDELAGAGGELRSGFQGSFVRKLLLVATLGLLLRLVVVWTVPTQPTSDFWSYFQRALNLVRSGRYEAIPGRVDASYPPAYSLLLATAFQITPGANSLFIAKLVNCGLGVLSLLVGALLTRRFWGDRAGLIAAVWFAFFPRYLLMVCLLASENLFTPLLLLFVYLAVEACQSARPLRTAAFGGAALGLLGLTRTAGYLLGFLWPITGIAVRKKWRLVLAETALVLAVQHAVMLPWAIRNSAALGRFTFLNTAGGVGLFLGNNPNATGYWYDPSQDLERVLPGITSRSPLEVSDVASRAAKEWIRNHPWEAARLYLKKLGIIFSQSSPIVADFAIYGTDVSPPWPGIDVIAGKHFLKRVRGAVSALLHLSCWLLLLSGVAGLLLLLRQAIRPRECLDRCLAVAFPAAALYVPVTSAIIAVNGRYRWPTEDVLIPASALFLASLPRLTAALRRRRTAKKSSAEE